VSGDPIKLVLITITQISKRFFCPVTKLYSGMIEYPIFRLL
jgi:hypothetical protein